MFVWMIGIVGMSALLCLAAWLAEKAARVVRAPTRWIWAVAILGPLLLPAAIHYASAEWISVSASLQSLGSVSTGNVAPSALSQWSRSLGGPAADAWQLFDPYLLYAWIVVSAGLSVVLMVSHATWLRRRRGWARGILVGSAVYFAPNLGPAVMGFLRPTIIVPTWIKNSPPSQQALVLAHENAHIEACDPQLLTLALGLCVLVPWNLSLWWQLKRLRNAVEIDCDVRVLKSGHDASDYGEALLAVGLRQSRVIGTAIAMSESRSFLEERIANMIKRPAPVSRFVAIGFAGLAMVLTAVAADVAPTGSLPPAVTQAAADAVSAGLVTLSPSALDGFVGYYKADEHSVMVVTREYDHLDVQSSGEPQAEAVYPEGVNRFFYADMKIDAKIEFEMDTQGQPTSAVLLQNGGRLNMPRIDVAGAQQIEALRLAKVQSHTPSAGSEAALRHFIDGILSGRPDLNKLGAPLAGQVAKDLPRLQITLAPLGDLKSLAFRSVDGNGFDVYEATHAHGTSEWRVDVDSQGVITGAMFPVVTD